MHLVPLVVLLGWIPAGALLFRLYPARIAILANFFGGWAILPGALYVPTNSEFPYWFLGVCLPTTYILTKATVTAAAALAGLLLFARNDLARFRPALCDLPMAVWCCVPLLTAATHAGTLRNGLFGAAYQALAWGVPWLLGRIYFSSYDSLLLAAKACVTAAVCYVPVCLFELAAGPRLYAYLYGFQPYRWVGAERYFGYRPIGFLEDGNQLGIWMAAGTLIAVFLTFHSRSTRILRLRIGWVAVALAATTLLCQSAGSVVLLVLLLPFTVLKKRIVLRAAAALLILAIVGYAAFRMTNQVSLRALAEKNRVLRSIAYDLSSIGRHSLVWRLARDESHITAALQHPLLGSGEWNWWREGNARPWSLWLLVFGMYGAVGLLAFASILFLPIYRGVWTPNGIRDPDHAELRLALAALILMLASDSLLNAALILPYLVIMGGIASPPKPGGAYPERNRRVTKDAQRLDAQAHPSRNQPTVSIRSLTATAEALRP